MFLRATTANGTVTHGAKTPVDPASHGATFRKDKELHSASSNNNDSATGHHHHPHHHHHHHVPSLSASSCFQLQPTLGRVDPQHLQVGSKVWVSDAKVLWRLGEVQMLSTSSANPPQETQSVQVYIPEAPEAKVQELAVTKLYAFDPSHIVDHSDIALMNNLHEAPLLHLLRRRFEQDEIYTFTADILLSINPYKRIPLLYDVISFMEQDQATRELDAKKPHLFTIAEKAYREMKGIGLGGAPQSIIISGESGAGKTEASKYIMKYLATASKRVDLSLSTSCGSGPGANVGSTARVVTTSSALPSTANRRCNVHEKIEECVVLSNLILESFGNAKTARNDNSSRFGKYIQILYSKEGRMSGVSIRHFLLEKTRIVVPEANERNYHIFYQMLAGLDNEVIENLCLKDVWSYAYLCNGECVKIDGTDDAEEFLQLRKCMSQLGMNDLFQNQIFELLAAILHLGNVKFESINENNTPAIGNQEDNAKTLVTFMDVTIEQVGKMLGVDPKELERKMTTQTTITGRGSILEMKLTPDQAKAAIDAFCKYLYGHLFNHIVEQINDYAKMETSEQDPAPSSRAKSNPSSNSRQSNPSSFIGILDIFGFEVLQSNSFEQLCINYTNEMLQQQFNKHVFVLEQERYAAEGIEFSVVEFKDNQECLDLIQKPPTGLLPLLDEQIMLKRKVTDRQLLTIYHKEHLEKKHPNYAKPRFESDEFILRHYAGDVTYDINGFIAKNNDSLHDDLLDLLRNSAQQLIASMFNKEPSANNSTPSAVQSRSKVAAASASAAASVKAHHRRQQSASTQLTGSVTVASRFRNQLAELMEVLWSTTPSYIKCIKPNSIKFPGGFSCELVRDQLVYSGVLEVVRIRQQGYPLRKPFEHFFKAFSLLAMDKFRLRQFSPKSRDDFVEVCRYIGEKCLAKNTFQIGSKEVFLRYGQLDVLEKRAHDTRKDQATVIQSKFYRSILARRKYIIIKTGFSLLQAIWKGRVQSRRYQSMKQSVVRIQTKYRGYRHRKRFHRIRVAAKVAQRCVRSALFRRRQAMFHKKRKASTKIQAIAKGYLQRTRAERQRRLREKKALLIQSVYKGYVGRRQFLKTRAAAIKIQSEWRSVCGRRRFLRDKSFTIASQAIVRQVLQRKKFIYLKKMVVRAQSFLRMARFRLQYLRMRRASQIIQTYERRRSQRKRYLMQIKAVYAIQHAVRGAAQRRRFLRTVKCIVLIQRFMKTALLKAEYRRAKAAIRKLQTFLRHLHRKLMWANFLQRVLHWCDAGESDLVVEALRNTPELAYIRYRDRHFDSLLHIAASNSDVNIVQFLLTKDPSLLTSKNQQGRTPFHECCAKARMEIARFMLSKCEAEGKTRQAQGVVSVSSTSVFAHKVERDGVITVYRGYLRKRRETSRWMKRYVVLRNTNNVPELHYYGNDKPATLAAKSDKMIDLRTALFKKSVEVPYAFEVHSPHLLQGRNREGRLYFAAENEFELQKWLSCLRDTVPTSIDSRLFSMHRSDQLHFVDFDVRKALCNQKTSKLLETPLHLAAASSADETETIKVALWLVENGSELDAVTKDLRTPLKIAFQSSNMALAKHFLDRGALTTHLSSTELEQVQKIKALLSKNAINSVGSSLKHDTSTPTLFLQKRPGLVRNSSYVSLFVEQIGISNPSFLSRPRIVISVFDSHRNMVEMKQQVSIQPVVLSSSLLWFFTWHMQTPLENLPAGAYIVLELTITPSISATNGSSPASVVSSASSSSSSTVAAEDIIPVCWTFVQVDPRISDSSVLNTEMFKYPMDLTLKKLQRVDAFVSGEMLISHGPSTT